MEDFLSVCSGCLFPRHGYSFKDTTVWSSPNDSNCLRLGVSVLKISNLPIPEVAFFKRKNLAIICSSALCFDFYQGCTSYSAVRTQPFFLVCIMKVRVKRILWTEIDTYCTVTTWMNHTSVHRIHFMWTFIIHKKKAEYFHLSKMQYTTQRLITELLI